MLDLNQTPAEEMQGAASERYSRSTNQPDAEYIWTNLSEQQKLVASNSFNVYCRPVQIYNKIQSRDSNDSFAVVESRRNSISFSYVYLSGKAVGSKGGTHRESYHVRRISTFEGPTGIDWDGINHVRISFMLPHIEKLAVETNCDKYFLFILTSAENPISLSTVNARTLTSEEVASNESSGGEKCVYGKVSLKFLYEILNISPDSPLQYRTEIQFSTQLRSCNLKYWLKHYTRTTSSTISIRDSNDSEVEGISKKLEISTSFEEFGAASGRTQERKEEPSSSLLPHFTWSPGIESEEFPSVSVSVKNENWLREFIDPKVDTFMYCVKKPKSRKMKTSSHGRNDTDPLLDVELRIGIANARLQENMVQQDQPDEVTTLEVEQEQVSNAVSDPSQGCVSSVSDHDETRGVQEVDHEEISNAIVVYTGEDCVPAISDIDNGALTVLEEVVSNATIWHTNEDSVSPVSEHDAVPQDAVPQDAVQQDAVPQDAVPQDAEQQDAVQQDAVQQDAVQQDAVQQDAVQQDEVSNAIMLHPSPDFVPFVPMNEGTSSVTQAEEKEKLLSERCDPNMLARWKKRTFYHSHTYQAMDLEEVVKDEDSEDEINEGARVIEDRRV
ncbi:Polycomb group protein [Vigna angularis]|uniref:Polycomb group protein n=1 Tax=Phaseolus angularis TaxID=3914 RepID=A0A8T0KQE8_PHAAN|nr:Polycomb group protein [Vigna angularis]